MMEVAPLFLLLWMPGPTELIIIGVVILLLFGGRKIPELMRGLGKGVKEFKEATNEEDEKGKGTSDSGADEKEGPEKKDR